MTPISAVRIPITVRAAAIISALSVIVLVGYVIWSGVEANHRADDALATVREHDHVAAAAAKAAAADTQDKLDALARILRAHGIAVPKRIIIVRRGAAHHHVRPRHHAAAHRHVRPRRRRHHRAGTTRHPRSSLASTPLSARDHGKHRGRGHHKH